MNIIEVKRSCGNINHILLFELEYNLDNILINLYQIYITKTYLKIIYGHSIS